MNGRALTCDDVARLPDGAEVWYAYDPAASATTHAWSGEEERTGAVRPYRIGETIERDTLMLACRTHPGSSRFYASRTAAADHLASSRNWGEAPPATSTAADSLIAAPQMALFSNG